MEKNGKNGIKRLHEPFDDIEEMEDQGSAEFAALLQESEQQHFRVGELVSGTVVEITPDHIILDIKAKAEGRVKRSEFTDPQGELLVAVGDTVKIAYEGGIDGDGYMQLSKSRADRARAWEKIEAAGGEGGVIEGAIVGKVKGGLTVDIGLPAFLPASQVDLRPVGNLDRLIGQTFRFRIERLNRKRGSVVLSRRALLEEERAGMREKTLANLAEGAILEGIVKNITDYGAFVDLGGIDGLLHVTDMSWGRLSHPSSAVNVGDKVTVKVLRYDQEKGRISLGMKQAMPDPWLTVADKYTIESRVSGKVVSLTDYGAFIALEDGVEGLIHVSEMSWTKRVKHPSAVLSVGDEVEAVVLGVDAGNRRISLGLKQVQENPWKALAERYPVGTLLEGEIKNITDFGVFIGIEEGIDGLVHVSDISWTKRIKHPGELYKKGDKVQAVVLKVDVENERLSLGVKQLSPDPWSLIPDKFRPGTRVRGTVSSLTDFGIFLELEEGVEGLVHVSELSTEKVESAKTFANLGDELEALVVNIDPHEKKIGLSLKALQAAKEKEEISAYLGSNGEATSNLGALLQGLKKNGNDD